ncbi:MAG: PhnD/SsuA/transferrin family substrate-binding protein [Venatoribacter sp.]
MRILAVLAGLLFVAISQAAPLPKLVLAGPPAGVSYPLVHLANSGELADLADEVEFVLWKNPDQLRALVLDNKVDFMALPSNVGANLYNRGVDLSLINVSQWGVLWMISRDANKKTLADFKGEEIALPFRADMPDIVFSYLAEKQGLNPKKDFKINYSASPADAMQLLIMRRVDHALLAEPAVSMALRKTQSFPLSIVAPDLYRSVDLQAEWGRLNHSEARIPQAGIAAVGKVNANAELVARFEQAFAKANSWCLANAKACSEEVAKAIPMLTAEGVEDALNAQNNYYADAQTAKAELEQFFSLLLEKQPATVGNQLPKDSFYFKP